MHGMHWKVVSNVLWWKQWKSRDGYVTLSMEQYSYERDFAVKVMLEILPRPPHLFQNKVHWIKTSRTMSYAFNLEKQEQ